MVRGRAISGAWMAEAPIRKTALGSGLSGPQDEATCRHSETYRPSHARTSACQDEEEVESSPHAGNSLCRWSEQDYSDCRPSAFHAPFEGEHEANVEQPVRPRDIERMQDSDAARILNNYTPVSNKPQIGNDDHVAPPDSTRMLGTPSGKLSSRHVTESQLLPQCATNLGLLWTAKVRGACVPSNSGRYDDSSMSCSS